MVPKPMNLMGKFQKSELKSKKFLKSLEILFRAWKHIFCKNYFENQKFSENFRNNVYSLETYFW